MTLKVGQSANLAGTMISSPLGKRKSLASRPDIFTAYFNDLALELVRRI